LGSSALGAFPQEKGGHAGAPPDRSNGDYIRRWNADHTERSLDGDNDAEVKLLAGNRSFVCLPGAGGIQEG
jgi:hypothetical protein